MPISAEQWRASVGAANASRRPFQPKRRWPCWEVFLCLLAALLVSTLLPGGGWRGTGSRKGMSKGRGGGTRRELAPSLLIAPRRRFMLVISGDIETNPGPVIGYGVLDESDLELLVEDLQSVQTKWEAIGRRLDIREETLEDIRTQYSHIRPGDALREIFRNWLPNFWHNVVRALRSVGEERLATELKVKYGLLEKSDLDVVASELDAVSSKWYTLGQELLLPSHHNELDSIHNKNPQKPKIGLRQMLNRRMDYYPPPTWSDIIAGLRSSGNSQLADHLETKYCSSLLHESHLDVVVNELATISGKWESLGEQLGIPSGYMDNIHTRYPNPADGMKELIKQWLQQYYHGFSLRGLKPSWEKGLRTWSHVVLALKSPEVGESQLGERLKQKYLPGHPVVDQPSAPCEGTAEYEAKPGQVTHDQVEHYSDLEFMEKVGGGGYGTVSKGRWISRDKIVAIKTLIVFDEREVRILSSLNHPSIIQYYGTVEEKALHFIVTEFAENGSVYDYIHVEHKDPSLDQRMLWAKEVVEVLLTSELKAKICDLGSARILEHTTKQTDIVGTYAWMAPEMINRMPVSKLCDVYSFGIFLWELITQQQPFSDVIPKFKVMAKVADGEHPPIPEMCEWYLAKLLNHCWQKEAKARPSFEEILSILNKDTPPSDATSQPSPSTSSRVTTADMKLRIAQAVQMPPGEI